MIRVLIITANYNEMKYAFEKIDKYLHDDLYGAYVDNVFKAAIFRYSGCLMDNYPGAIINAPNLCINIYPYDYVHSHPDCLRARNFDYCMLETDASDWFKRELFSGMRMHITDFTDLKTIIRETIFYGKPKNEYFNPDKNFKQIITKRLNSFGVIVEDIWRNPVEKKSNLYTFIFKKGDRHIMAGYEHKPEFGNRRLIGYINEFIDSVVSKFNTVLFCDTPTMHDKIMEYCNRDDSIVKPISEYYKKLDEQRANIAKIVQKSNMPEIKKVIFNGPATIVFWSDGTKTISKAAESDSIDAEKGLALAISKKVLGNYANFKKLLPKHEQEPENRTIADEVLETVHRIGQLLTEHDRISQAYNNIINQLR